MSLFRVAGLAFITVGAAMIALVLIRAPGMLAGGFAAGARSPSDALPLLLYLITDVCYLVAFPGLAAALWPTSRAAVLLMVVFALAASVLDLQGTLVLVALATIATAAPSMAPVSDPFIEDYLWLVMTPLVTTLLSLAVVIAGRLLTTLGLARRTGQAGLLLGGAGALAGALGLPAIYLLLVPWYVAAGLILIRLRIDAIDDPERVARIPFVPSGS